MKTTVLKMYRLLYNSMHTNSYSTGVCVRATYKVQDTPAYILYMVCSYIESNSVLVADDGDTVPLLLCRRQGEELHART